MMKISRHSILGLEVIFYFEILVKLIFKKREVAINFE